MTKAKESPPKAMARGSLVDVLWHGMIRAFLEAVCLKHLLNFVIIARHAVFSSIQWRRARTARTTFGFLSVGGSLCCFPHSRRYPAQRRDRYRLTLLHATSVAASIIAPSVSIPAASLNLGRTDRRTQTPLPTPYPQPPFVLVF
jgi:hypothetical protein